MLPFINLSLWSGRGLCHFAHTDNALLGIRALRGAELDALLREEIEKAANAFGLVGRCSHDQILEAEARGHRALETGMESLSGWDARCYVEGEAARGVSLS